MNRDPQAGMTLVELMIAMVIGLVLIGASASVYIANKDTYRTSETVARMQENGRIALHVIVDDLRMAGFMGNNTNPVLVENRSGSPAPLAALSGTSGTQDCADRWYIDTTSMLLVGNNQTPALNGVPFSTTCLLNKGYQATTDVIALKRAATGDILDINVGNHVNWTLIRSDLMRGAFFLGGTPLPAGLTANTTNRRWLAHVYFIAPDNSSEIPELRRLTLGSGPNLYNRELVPGVQDLQIHYGIDTDGNGSPDSFVEPGNEGAAAIVAARIWLLMRSETREFSHNDSLNTYNYANKSYTPGDGSGIETADNPEQFRRLLLSATVMLRNNR
ncbi:MAG TPA: PilW family protein [Gammaproteobacteria bacterium]